MGAAIMNLYSLGFVLALHLLRPRRAKLEKVRSELDQAREENGRARSQIQEVNRALDAAQQQVEVLERVSKDGDRVVSQLNAMLSSVCENYCGKKLDWSRFPPADPTPDPPARY